METERAAIALQDSTDNPIPSTENSRVFVAEDEFTNLQKTLAPLPGYELFQDQFNYYARTRNLEVNSPRVAMLQGIADKMTEGTSVATRVVIMNKGKDSQAFVTADGTIFISQSLINELGSLDEVAGVLAHEVGHRINKTHERKGSRSNPTFAVGWIHEIAADNLAPHLLEKAGLNSFGLAKAIAKTSANQRGIEHQTGEARATQVTIQHGGIHYATSSQELTPAPESLKTTAIVPTNIEIIGDILKNRDPEGWKKAIGLLHPEDLGAIYTSLAKTSTYYGSDVSIEREMLESTIELMSNRLAGQGLSREFIDLYFLASQEDNLKSFSMINTPQQLVVAIDQIGLFIDQNVLVNTQNALFHKPIISYITSDYVPCHILESLAYGLCDLSKTPERTNIPVTRDSLITVLQKIHKVSEQRKLMYIDNETRFMSKVAVSYISNAYIQGQDNENVASESVYQLFLKLKEAGIPLSRGEIKNGFSWGWAVAGEKVLAAYDWVFPPEKEMGLESLTEDFIKNFTESDTHEGQRHYLDIFLQSARSLMDKADMSDGKRKIFLDSLHSHLPKTVFVVPEGIAESLHLGIKNQAEIRNAEEGISRLNLDLAFGLSIFQKDGDEFYDYMSRSIAESGVDFNQFSWFGLANVCTNLLYAPSDHHPIIFTGRRNDPSIEVRKVAKVEDIQRLLSLTPLQDLIRRQPGVAFTLHKDFNRYAGETFADNLRFYQIRQIYDDSLPALILGHHLRVNAEEIFRSGIKETEYNDLYEFIDHCLPNGQERSRVLRAIKRQFLTSKAIGLDQKTDYIVRNFDDIGIEGMIEVAEQITTLSDYRKFHDKLWDKISSYLDGSLRITELAAMDSASSNFVDHFHLLLLTAKNDPKSKREASTGLAKTWYDYTLKHAPDTYYDPKLKKVILGSAQRQAFRSLGDLIDNLKNLTPLQRFGIAMKALVDKRGAMTTDENRKLLGDTIVDALGINSSFINSAIKVGCMQAPANFASIPAAQIIAPLLFKNLDAGSVEKSFFEGVDDELKKEIGRLMRSSTRDVTAFGVKYLRQPGSYGAREVSASDRQYRDIGGYLVNLFPPGKISKENDVKSEIDPPYEAVISGVENSGPLGTRGLQLTRQLLEFSPAIDRRLARSLDNAAGLNKLLFWENILKMIDDAKAGRLNEGTDPEELVDFFERRMVSLDEILGRGSIFTTFAAKVIDENGQIVNAVIKMIRPNPKVFIKASYETASEVFTEIGKTGSEKDKRLAGIGNDFILLAQNWCLSDILDKTFPEDDDKFRTIVGSFNKQAGRVIFRVPKRLMTCFYIKSETRAPGGTVNELLEDNSVRPELKKKIVGLVVNLFHTQLRQAVDGVHLVHSDPHVGNYMVDIKDGELDIGVIDRSMYLKLDPEQAKAFDKLLSSGNYRGFVSSFIDQVMDHNKVINEGVRKTTKGNILSALTRKYLSQKVQSLRRFSLDVDNFALLRKMLEEFDRAKLDIPLEMRLMIKSVESLRELQKRFR